MKKIISSVLCLVLVAMAAVAQEVRATLTGTVLDPQGAAVPHANIEIRNLGTNVVVRSTATDAGLYVAPDLNPGQYTVTARAAGVNTTATNSAFGQVNPSQGNSSRQMSIVGKVTW